MTKILRNDLQIISSLIEENEKVLDVGCGNGNLIEFLSKEKNVDCKGIEIELEKMNFCLKTTTTTTESAHICVCRNAHPMDL